jgi:CRP/FNR family transcriptional regulator
MQTLRTNLEEKLVALRACPYFAGLEDRVLGDLTVGMRLARFGRDEAVFWQDEPCAGLHIVRRGSVKLFKLSPSGREFIVNIFKDGATFNEVPVFDEGKNPINVVSLEETDLWVIDPQVIRNTMKAHPEMSKAVILNLARNLRMFVGIVEEVSFYQVTHRLARLLTQLSAGQLAGKPAERVTHDQLAARLGTVREVVARSLKELERSGAIRLSQRRIYVVDEAILHEWAQRPG